MREPLPAATWLQLRARLAPLALALLGLGVGGCGAEPVDRPNIVLIVSDDQGYRDFGFMGNDLVETPRLDRLASEGTVFTTAYNTASVCQPALLSLLTGLTPYQVELREKQLQSMGRARNFANRIVDFETLPGLLALRGYRSFQAGKHWEGSATQAGFTEGTKQGELRGPSVMRMSGGMDGLQVGRTTMEPVWDFLDGAEGEPAEPFLLWFAPFLPHIPMNAPPPYRDRFAGRDLAPSALAYYANIAWLDDAVGELLDRLEEMGALERTLVVFLADNGWDNPPDVDHGVGRGEALGGPRGKLSMNELGFRTPIVFRWPGRVPSGVRRDDLVSTLDLFPTLLRYAGLIAPPGRLGTDLTGAIERGEPLEERTLYGYMKSALAPSVGAESPHWQALRREAWWARTPRYHYFQFPANSGSPAEARLYDVANDPDERTDLAAKNPETVAELKREIREYERRLRETLPKPSNRLAQWTEPATRQPSRSSSQPEPGEGRAR